MEEQQQVKNEPQQQVKKEPQQVTTKDPKKVKAGKRLAEWNRNNKKELRNTKQPTKVGQSPQEVNNNEDKQESGISSTQCYGIGAIVVVAVAGVVVYKVWGNPFNKVSNNSNSLYSTPPVEQSKSSTNSAENKFELK